MKTKLILTSLLSFLFYLLSSQVPQGFNYQAIARDGSGNPIVGGTIDVKLGIQADTSATPVILWEEQHTGIKTNAFGLFTVILGQGTKTDGTAATFTDVNWLVIPLYLKTQIYYNSAWKYMGSSKLWSVPYALVANDLGGPVKKLAVTGTTSVMDEALFEVKNKNGQTVFAVYNEGVRIYVDNGLAKGQKGGFAIGGFGTDKGTSQPLFVVNYDSIRGYIYDDPLVKGLKGGFAIGGFNGAKASTNDYLLVSPDSVRVLINNAPSTKGQKGGFAIGGFDPAKGSPQKLMTISDDSIRMYINDIPGKGTKGGFAIGGFNPAKGAGPKSFLNVATDDGGIVNPAQNRILWYPLKNAFMTGRVLIANSADVGLNSFASGYESKAIGAYSQALGFKCVANGESSLAMGHESAANMPYSTALGDFNTTNGNSSLAVGSYNTSTGVSSLAIGRENKAVGNYSMAIGYASETGTEAYSCAIGFLNKATGAASVALGGWSTASGWLSFAMGYGSLASGLGSSSIGYESQATGSRAFATGFRTRAYGDQSQTFGDNTEADAGCSTAFGWLTKATGNYSFVLGENTTAQAYSSLVLGHFNIISGNTTSWVDSDPVFVIGNGTSGASRSNALTILKNGNIGVGYSTPASALHIQKSITGHLVYLKNSLNSGSGYGMVIFAGQDGVNSGAELITFYSPNQTLLGRITQNGSGSVAYNTTSDLRLKENIIDTKFSIIDLMKVKVRDFNFINDRDKESLTGFVAQELYEVFPSAVSKPAEINGYWGIDYGKLTPLIIKGIQDQNATIEFQNIKIEEQAKEIKLLKEEVEQIKALLVSEGNR